MPEGQEVFPRHSRDAVTSRLRLRGHDYSAATTYFVTLCTADRACLFGDVQNGEVLLNDAGVVVDSWWHSIPNRFSSIWIDEVIVMPNHLHGIIGFGADPEIVESSHALSDVVGWFKTRTVNDYGLGVRTLGWPRYSCRLWQPGYFEHIIRSDAALERIRRYIVGNPARWTADEEYPDRRTGRGFAWPAEEDRNRRASPAS